MNRLGSSFGRCATSRGAGLIEVLVAVLVMAIGLLGVAAMQASALRNSQSALERSQAVVQTYTILDAMRANRPAALAGAYSIGMTCGVPAAGTLAQTDLSQWIAGLKSTLNPSACGSITRSAGDVFIVTVRWNDQRASGKAVEDNVSVITRTQL
jgi:type IV pilus assembly protein PilV